MIEQDVISKKMWIEQRSTLIFKIAPWNAQSTFKGQEWVFGKRFDLL